MLSKNEAECITACNECVTACLQCASACLEEGDPKKMTGCITADFECTDICQITAAAIARGDAILRRSAAYVLTCVRPVRRNVASIWLTTASSALMHAKDVQQPVVRWQTDAL